MIEVACWLAALTSGFVNDDHALSADKSATPTPVVFLHVCRSTTGVLDQLLCTAWHVVGKLR